MHLQELGHMVEISNVISINIFSIINMSWYGKCKNSTIVYQIINLMFKSMCYTTMQTLHMCKKLYEITNTLKTTEQTEEDHEVQLKAQQKASKWTLSEDSFGQTNVSKVKNEL